MTEVAAAPVADAGGSDAGESTSSSDPAPQSALTSESSLAGEAPQGGAEAAPAAAPPLPDFLKQTADGKWVFNGKVDGEEVEIPLEYALNDGQRARAFTKKSERLALERQEFDRARQEFTQKPWEFIQQADTYAEILERGFRSDDPAVQQALAAKFDQLAREAELPEEERRANESRRRMQENEQRNAQLEQQYQERVQQIQADRYREQLTPQLHKALQTAGVPATSETIGQIAQNLRSLTQAGYKLTPEVMQYAASAVHEGYQTQVSNLVQSLDGAALTRFLGPEAVKKLNQHSLEAAKRQTAEPAPVGGSQVGDRIPPGELQQRQGTDDYEASKDEWKARRAKILGF